MYIPECWTWAYRTVLETVFREFESLLGYRWIVRFSTRVKMKINIVVRSMWCGCPPWKRDYYRFDSYYRDFINSVSVVVITTAFEAVNSSSILGRSSLSVFQLEECPPVTRRMTVRFRPGSQKEQLPMWSR